MNLNNIDIPSKLFITGIDTDAGKSFVTGYVAKALLDAGKSVITQKFIQTGNNDFSEDIEVHRKIMEIPYTPEDESGLTAPVIFTYPASPDLAARIDKKDLDFTLIEEASEKLSDKYEYLLIEGAGGLMVPLKDEYLTIDYIKELDLPVLFVTNGRLGSINHTLLSLYSIKNYGIKLFGVVYNSFFDKDKIICDDTKGYIKKWLNNRFPDSVYLEI
ncbi:MAG: dethiobiotin synthase [Muribaculaceae bacterium]|nr:dethiobiotin synthase [Muribaculaceae bacterium]